MKGVKGVKGVGGGFGKFWESFGSCTQDYALGPGGKEVTQLLPPVVPSLLPVFLFKGNVMFKHSARALSCWQAKVGDFGLSR